MGPFDDLFGGFFDLDGDGRTDAGEEFLGYVFLSELEPEEHQRQELPADDDS